jgi:hypothetical protein
MVAVGIAVSQLDLGRSWSGIEVSLGMKFAGVRMAEFIDTW